jgi:hypothetical protein
MPPRMEKTITITHGAKRKQAAVTQEDVTAYFTWLDRNTVTENEEGMPPWRVNEANHVLLERVAKWKEWKRTGEW